MVTYRFKENTLFQWQPGAIDNFIVVKRADAPISASQIGPCKINLSVEEAGRHSDEPVVFAFVSARIGAAGLKQF